MEPSTAKILAMVNKPDYDLNNIPRSDAEALSRLSRNTSVADAYEVGSIFKILTLASALDTGAITNGSTFYCPGYHIVNGVKIKCWTQRPHGSQSLLEAAANSCNPAFMQMGLAIGTDAFYEKLYAFGLGSTSGSLLSGEAPGIVTLPKYVRDTDLARISFGQSIAVTPLQMITAASAAINGGILMQPMIVNQVTREDGIILARYEPNEIRRVISQESSAKVREILEYVVDNGTGRNAAIEGYSVGGKTGTAQKYDEEGKVTTNSHVASFIGFAPADDPQVIVLVLVDNPKVGTHYGSTAAAPYASQILEETLHYLNVAPDRAAPDDGTVEMPDVTDMALEDALLNLAAKGLSYIVEGYGAYVADQIPKSGTMVSSGDSVILCLENYDEMTDGAVKVPQLLGKTPVQALEELRELGLILEMKGVGGYAIEQSPEKDTEVMEGATVTVTFVNDEQEDEDDDG